MEGRDRELKLANERIGVLTRRIEELEQERSRKHQGQERQSSSKQVKGETDGREMGGTEEGPA